MSFMADGSARLAAAQVEYNDSVYSTIDLASFYTRYYAGQQKLYAQLMSEQSAG